MAEQVAERAWRVQGTTIRLPVEITGARFVAAVFRADRGAVEEVLAGTPLRALARGGQAVSALFCVHYDEWALGSYEEVGVAVLARGPGGRPGLHVVDLPVTQGFTEEAGRDIWGLPKWLMGCDLVFTGRGAEVTVTDDGSSVLAARFAGGRVPVLVPVPVRVPTWACPHRGAQADRLLRGALVARPSRARLGRGRLALRLGRHPMADRMRALGMTRRPLLTVSADLVGRLDAADVVG